MIEDFHKICRTCLSEITDYKYLFNVHYINGENLRLAAILTACTAIEVLENDDLPQQVCTNCENNILNVFSFQKLCHKSDMILKGILSQSVQPQLELKPLVKIEEDSSISIYNTSKQNNVNHSAQVENPESYLNDVKDNLSPGKILNEESDCLANTGSSLGSDNTFHSCMETNQESDLLSAYQVEEEETTHKELQTYTGDETSQSLSSLKNENYFSSSSHTESVDYQHIELESSSVSSKYTVKQDQVNNLDEDVNAQLTSVKILKEDTDYDERNFGDQDFQGASISSSTDKRPSETGSEIVPIPTIHIGRKQLTNLQNARTINFEDDQELSEPEPFGSGGSESEYLPSSESECELSGKSRSSSTVPDTPENTLLSKTERSRSLFIHHSEILSPMETDEETDKLFSGVTSSINKTKANELVMINCAKKTSGGKRIRNKEHSCYFCHKLLRNLARHFEKVHSNETEVARILSMPKNSKRRREAFNALTRNGDFYHNCDVLFSKKGELILTRRPTEQERKFLQHSDYGPCPECLGFMIKRHIWHHLKYSCICMRDKNILSSKIPLWLPAAESSSLLKGIYGRNLTEDFRSNILNKLRNDEISEICRKDDLILRFGAFLYEKYSSTRAELIRQSMRQLGWLTIELAKKNTHVHKLVDALTPEKFDAVVLATKSLCATSNNEAERTEFGIPSLALKIGYSIRKCIGLERCLCLRKGQLKRNEMLLRFLSVLDLEWYTRISSNELATLQSRKLNIRVHRKFHRLHENTFELTKVSRSRQAVDQEKAHIFAGKSLEDIDVKDLPPIEEDSSDQNDGEADEGKDGEIVRYSAEVSSRSTTNEGEEFRSEPFIDKRKQKSEKNKFKKTRSEAALSRVPWNDSEKKVIMKKFETEIKNGIVPGKARCTEIKEEHNDILRSRSWRHIKFFVKNVISRNKSIKK